MLTHNLRQNHTILAKYQLLPTRSQHAVIDRNHDGEVEMSYINPNSSAISEPILDIDLKALRNFADLNETGTILNKDSYGEIDHFSARWTKRFVKGRSGGEHQYSIDRREEQGSLSGLTNELNPFPDQFGDKPIEWAIDIAGGENSPATLYILTDKE